MAGKTPDSGDSLLHDPPILIPPLLAEAEAFEPWLAISWNCATSKGRDMA